MRIKKINALMVIVVMLISILGNKNNIMLKAANEEKGNYIIIAKTSNDANKIKTQYVTQTVCVNGGEELEENNIVSTRITATEAVRLQETKGVKSVEKDAVVSACSIKKQIHPKKIKLYKKSFQVLIGSMILTKF